MKRILLSAALLLVGISAAPAADTQTTVTTPPSVDNGVGNGVVKPAGSPSVGNGVGNGVVKAPGAPAVSDGVANGVAKSPMVEQKTQ